MQLQIQRVNVYELADGLLDALIKFLESLSLAVILGGLGAVFLMASFVLGWYGNQLTLPSGGYMFPILENSLGHPERALFSFMSLFVGAAGKYHPQPHHGLVLLSFGSVALMLGILGSLTVFRPLDFLRVPIGIAALLLGITFIAKLACFHSNLLELLIDINDQHAKLLLFSTIHLPPNNLGYEPTYIPGFKTDYLLDRFEAAFYFASWGWYLTMAGGLLLLSTGLYGGREEEEKGRFVKIGSVLLLLVLYSLGLVMPDLLAEYRQLKGDSYLAQGKYEAALEEYSAALSLNDQLFYHKLFRENLGEVYYKLGRVDKPEYYIYRGELLNMEGKSLSTLDAYERALQMSPEDPVIKRLLVSFYIQQGLDYFNTGSNKYSAIQSWKNALELDPNQVQAHFYMGKAYFDTGNYEQGILENQTFIAQSINSILKANAYSNIGDGYVKLERFNEARAAYLMSRSLDRILNNRMTDSLAGGI